MKYIIPNANNKKLLTDLVVKVGDPSKLMIIENYHEYLNPESNNSIYNVDCEVLLSSREAYDYLVSLDKAGLVHFGLRSYNYFLVYSMEVLTLGKCRFVVVNEFDENQVDKIKFFIKYNCVDDKKYELKSKKYYTCDDGEEALKLFNEDRYYGFDFESAGFPTDEDFVPVGIGISSEDLGVYIDFRYYSSEDSKNKFMEAFKSWVKQHSSKLICYYASFEVNALRFMFHDFYPLADCLAMVKCDNRTGSLKLNAQNYLHINSWDDDQDDLMSSLDEIFNLCNTWEEVKSKYNEFKNILPIANELKKLENSMICYSYDTEKYNLLNEQYSKIISDNQGELSQKDFEYNCYLSRCLDKIMNSNFDSQMYDKFKGYPFAVTPTSVTGLYCIYDAYYTLMTFEEINRRGNYG